MLSRLVVCAVIVVVGGRHLAPENSYHSEHELVFVSVFFRHGDRTPLFSYPKDPYNNETFWPAGWGQLTDLGKNQQYLLGKWLRRRYDGFLPMKYSRNDIYVQSTDVDRTLMSATVNLAGLYEPQNSNWNKELKWQPIPVHTIPRYLDEVLAALKSCPKHSELLENVKKSEEFVKLNEEYKHVYEYLTEHTGVDVESLDEVIDIYEVLEIEKSKNFTLPEWVGEVYPEPLRKLSQKWFRLQCYTKEMCRLDRGPLIKQIVGHLKQKRDKILNQKMWMYAAHDMTIINLLTSFDIYDNNIPPYCSTLLFELWRREGKHFVKIVYKNSTYNEQVQTLTLPDCTTLCPLDRFLEISSHLVPEDWERECTVEGI